MYARVRLIEDVKRAFPLSREHNAWSTGQEFFVRQNRPDEGMVVLFCADAGIGIPPEAAEIIERFDSYLAAHNAYEALKARQQGG